MGFYNLFDFVCDFLKIIKISTKVSHPTKIRVTVPPPKSDPLVQIHIQSAPRGKPRGVIWAPRAIINFTSHPKTERAPFVEGVAKKTVQNIGHLPGAAIWPIYDSISDNKKGKIFEVKLNGGGHLYRELSKRCARLIWCDDFHLEIQPTHQTTSLNYFANIIAAHLT